MNVTVHLMASLRPSGMERMLVSGAKYWLHDGRRHVVLGFGPDHPFASELTAAGYHVQFLDQAPRNPQAVLKLIAALRAISPDVIHIHTEGNYLATALCAHVAAKGTRGAVIRTVHNIFDARGLWFISRRLQATIADRWVDAIAAPTDEVAMNEESRFGRSVAVISNWVDDAFFDIRAARQQRAAVDASRGRALALVVGNCSQIKNHDLALKAIERAGDLVVHIGMEAEMTRSESETLGRLESDGRIVGRGTHSPASALIDADYFLMPSTREGMGIALAEALVGGVPAVVADAPGLRWAQRFPNVVALPLEQAAWDEALFNRRWDSRVAPENLKQFSAQDGVAAYETLYTAALATRRRSSGVGR